MVLVLSPTGPLPSVPVGIPVLVSTAPAPVRASETEPGSTVARTSRPITRLVIASIALDTPVVPAPLADHDGASTWDVPPRVAGHAAGTPGAGEPGNAILLGHVTSVRLGNVFLHLDSVGVGDRVSVFSNAERFEYRVIEASDVDRADLSVLDQSVTPSLTLITCSGDWLFGQWDYARRRVVRAELV